MSIELEKEISDRSICNKGKPAMNTFKVTSSMTDVLNNVTPQGIRDAQQENLDIGK